MSKMGRKPISIPSGTTVSVNDNLLVVKGPKGELRREISPHVKIVSHEGKILVQRSPLSAYSNSLYGLVRSEIFNMVQGSTYGYEKTLELSGVGYKAQLEGKSLLLYLGFSHPVRFELPPGITASVERQTAISLRGIDKYLVGEVAARIRALRKPEPYKGKGVRYSDEHVRRKEGKTGK